MTPGHLKTVLSLSAVVVSLLAAAFGSSHLRRAEQWLAALARRRTLSVLFVFVVTIAARLVLLPIDPVPQPYIHDEFGYLLAADTFAHGHLVNPQHPMWIHFESYHIIVTPFYASKYYPAQGAFLAMGQVFFGHPWAGVLLSVAAMCAAICWMLQGWLPPGWALLGGVLALLRLNLVDYWINSYWGGAVTALGGALVLGALPRIQRRQRLRDALWMGLGLALLALSRPYEGVLLALPVGGALLLWFIRKRSPPARILFPRVIAPLALLAALTVGSLAFYNWRVTGHPFRLPYQVYESQYNPVPPFFWQPARPLPVYHHDVMRLFFVGWVMPYYELKRSSFVGFLEAENDGWLPLLFVLNLATIIPGIMLPLILRDRRIRFLIVVCAVSAAGSLLISFMPQPHYFAPVVGAIFGIVLQGMRHLRVWGRRTHKNGITLVRALVVLSVLLAVRNVLAVPLGLPFPESYRLFLERPQVKAQLESQPGLHLAIVRYAPGHYVHDEWVYNDADIDAAKVVWARDMGTAKNGELIRYFRNRQVWLIEPDADPPKVSPYPVSPTP